MNTTDAPFNTKIKLECECAACESKYRMIYFEDETTGDIKMCPFCGEPAEEFAETNAEDIPADLDEETIYTDDEYARFESDVIDDDDDLPDTKSSSD